MGYADYNPDDEESFASRYPETVPTDAQAAIDAGSAARVNAAGRIAATPGVGAPGSNPATNITNLQLADAMDRADIGNRFGFGSPEYQRAGGTAAAPTVASLQADDIAERRQAIEEQKRPILAKLGVIQPGEAGMSAVVLAQPQERHQLLQNLDYLEKQSRDLLLEHHDAVIEGAQSAHENFARESHIAAAKDFADLSNTLLQIRQNPNLKSGTPEFGAAILQAAKDHPHGFQTEAGQMLVRSMSDSHDKASTLEDRSYWQRFGQAHNEAAQVGKKFGVDVQYDDQGFPSVDATTKYGQDNGTIKEPPKSVNAAYVKQAAALAEVKSRKDAAYNTNPKADLTSHDNNIAREQAKLDAMKEALGMTETADNYTVGKKYKDANGNTATYLGNGKWQ